MHGNPTSIRGQIAQTLFHEARLYADKLVKCLNRSLNVYCVHARDIYNRFTTEQQTDKQKPPSQASPQALRKTAAQMRKHKTRNQSLTRAAARSSDTTAQRVRAASIAPKTDNNSRALALVPRLLSLLACHFSRSLSSMPKVSTCQEQQESLDS